MPNRVLYPSGPYRHGAYHPGAYQPDAYPFMRGPSGVEFVKHDQNAARPLHQAQGLAYPVPRPLQPKPRRRGGTWIALIIVHLFFGWMLYTAGPLLFALLFG
jgi:hypothetical protein